MTIINDQLGGGLSSGKKDEYGLPIAHTPTSPTEHGAHVSREVFLEDLVKVHPGKFIISRALDVDEAPEAHFYNPDLAPIEAGWKRGLYTLEAALGIEKVSVMVRKPHDGVVLKFYLASMSDETVAWESPEIDASTDVGINRVFKLPAEVILCERHAMFVEVVAAPDEWDCSCPMMVSVHTPTNDYCHEDYLSFNILQDGMAGYREAE